MTCKMVKFKKEHLEVMDIRAHEQEQLEQGDYDGLILGGPAVTGIVDGRVVCAGGLFVMAGGNASIWLIPSVHVARHAKTFVRELKKWLFGMREDFQLSRMQTVCLDDDLHNRWMRYLGFEKEGVLRNYYNGVDHVMYARVKWD